MMRKFLETPWLVAIAAVAIVGTAIAGDLQMLAFKSELLTTVMPAMLASLLAIAAVMERAAAVLNDIWFGEQREQQQETVRLTGKELQAARADLGVARAAYDGLIMEAIRSGNKAIHADRDAAPTAEKLMAIDNKVTMLASQLKIAEQVLVTTEAQVDRARLSFAFVVALIVAAVGVRALEAMFVVNFAAFQKTAFHGVDIVLTAGVLAGGTTGIAAIADLLGNYVNVSRKRVMESR